MQVAYEEVAVTFVRAEDVQRILFTATEQDVGLSTGNSDRSLIESTELLHDVKALPLEEHISASQWLSALHTSTSDSGN